ncbi:hypothetical protein Drorol1_Dr00008646 [Drosera rotundifolia]
MAQVAVASSSLLEGGSGGGGGGGGAGVKRGEARSALLTVSSDFVCILLCHENMIVSTSNAKDTTPQQAHTTGISSEVRYRSVSELSRGTSDNITTSRKVDMDKAFSGLAAGRPPDCGVPISSFRKSGEPRSSFSDVRCPELFVSGTKVPLDLTLKTKMRIVSSSPISWFHRVLMSSTYNGMTSLPAQFGKNHNIERISEPSPSMRDDGLNSLCSWIYPHSSLPPSVITALSTTTGGAESDFVTKRHRDWEDSFRNLYYMLRKNACDIFYVCTSQFIVMFVAFGAGGKTKRTCNAYISQSTRGLRSSLKEHDVCFSMPLCLSEVEQTCREDLVELSEIEKNNLGQTKRRNLMTDVDNSPESLLAFEGNEKTHGLYDFLLNYKCFLSSLTGADVPILCAPLPFRNAATSTPEVSCKEIKSIDFLASKFGSFVARDDAAVVESSGSICYSIEITDRFITPWVMGSICMAINSKGRSFEASFSVEPNSTGLNVALDAIDQNTDPEEFMNDKSYKSDCPLGMKALVAMELHLAWIKVLKCCIGNYTASLEPI